MSEGKRQRQGSAGGRDKRQRKRARKAVDGEERERRGKEAAGEKKGRSEWGRDRWREREREEGPLTLVEVVVVRDEGWKGRGGEGRYKTDKC